MPTLPPNNLCTRHQYIDGQLYQCVLQSNDGHTTHKLEPLDKIIEPKPDASTITGPNPTATGTQAKDTSATAEKPQNTPAQPTPDSSAQSTSAP